MRLVSNQRSFLYEKEIKFLKITEIRPSKIVLTNHIETAKLKTRINMNIFCSDL